MSDRPQPPHLSLVQIFGRFLRFGLCAWGGPTAQIALIHDDLVKRERWVDEMRFRRALAVYQALPGPEAHELCCWFGMIARGRAGAIAAGLGFMLPGFLLMLLAAWLYMRFGVRGTIVAGAFVALQAAVIGLMLRATVRICILLARGPLLGATAMMAAVAQLLLVPFWIPLCIGGMASALAGGSRKALAAPLLVGGIVLVLMLGSYGAMPASIDTVGRTLTVDRPSESRLFLTGLAGGMMSFGGAYTAIPVVHDAAVGQRGWMTDGQFLDGLAIGGVLPSPLVIFGTFVGFIGGQWIGALLVTMGIFLPAFGFTLVGHELLERVVESPRAHAFLDGIAASVAGLIATTSVVLLIRAIGLDWPEAGSTSTPSLDHPLSLLIAAIACTAFFVLKARWAIPLVLATAAAIGALIGTTR